MFSSNLESSAVQLQLSVELNSCMKDIFIILADSHKSNSSSL
jgi:hypothetical protein